MNQYQYTLEPYKGMNNRYRCPGCNKQEKTLSLYINAETGEHINPIVGRCNREVNCGYHYTPKQYFQDNRISTNTLQYRSLATLPTLPARKISFIPGSSLKRSLKGYEANNFIKYIIELLGYEKASNLISKYFIGTSKHWNGATIFWQIDISGNVRTGKVMLYSPVNGKRVKEPFNHITWVHKLIKPQEFELKQCFFGEHLLRDDNKLLAIVESEKTAIIASVYLPQFTWLAVGSLSNLNADKCKVLKGRTVILFPDLNGFEKWSKKAEELKQLASFTVSDLLERNATLEERKQGLDLADYLIKFEHSAFTVIQSDPHFQVKPAITPRLQEKLNPATNMVRYLPSTEEFEMESWEKDILELEKFFNGFMLPTKPIKLEPCTAIINLITFIESHFATVKANNGKRTFLPFLDRLQELKRLLIKN